MTLPDLETKESSITDVYQFFSEITNTYKGLEQRVQQLIHELVTLTPGQLEEACDTVRLEQDILKSKEEQLFEILLFAGEELQNSPMVVDCKAALHGANISCNILHHRLSLLREKLTLPKKLQQAINAYQNLAA